MDPQLQAILDRRRRASQSDEPAAAPAQDGGWEFLVDVGRDGAEALLTDRVPGTFLLRRKDDLTLAISYATPAGVEHALIWVLPGPTFKTGTRGPYNTLQELLYAVAALVPSGLVFDPLDIDPLRQMQLPAPRAGESAPVPEAAKSLPTVNGLSPEPPPSVSPPPPPPDADPLGVAADAEIDHAPPLQRSRTSSSMSGSPLSSPQHRPRPSSEQQDEDLDSIKAFLADEGDALLREAAAVGVGPGQQKKTEFAQATRQARSGSLFDDDDDPSAEDQAEAAADALTGGLHGTRKALREQVLALNALAAGRRVALLELLSRVATLEQACATAGAAIPEPTPAQADALVVAAALQGDEDDDAAGAAAAAAAAAPDSPGRSPVSFRGRARVSNDFLHTQLEGLGFDESRVGAVLDEMSTSEADLSGLDAPAAERRRSSTTGLEQMWSATPVFGGAKAQAPPASSTAAPAERPKLTGLDSLLSDDGDLFAGVAAEDEDQPGAQAAAAAAAEDAMPFGEFLSRIRRAASRDLREHIRRFVCSVLGPNGDATPPANADRLDYEFFGTNDLPQRTRTFFDAFREALRRHNEWKDLSEGTRDAATACLERYVMQKLHRVAFAGSRETLERDRALARRMRTLSFITPDHLEVPANLRNDVVWSLAVNELSKINGVITPAEKLDCVVKCAGLIFSVLNLARDGASRPGADDFLPVFIYVVLQSRIENLQSNCEYIGDFSTGKTMMSKAGYCFVNLRSAVEFIDVMDASVLAIEQDEFQRLVTENEERLRREDVARAQKETEAMAKRSAQQRNNTGIAVTAGPGRR